VQTVGAVAEVRTALVVSRFRKVPVPTIPAPLEALQMGPVPAPAAHEALPAWGLEVAEAGHAGEAVGHGEAAAVAGGK
jgi:hypothetical protein